jgi:hypothetical protein
MGAKEVSRFLSFLAVEGRVTTSTQNQALAALLFLYRVVLRVALPWLDELVRASGFPSFSPVKRCTPSCSRCVGCHASWRSSCTALVCACSNVPDCV